VDINGTGGVDLSLLSPSSRFNINLWSLSAPDTNGNASNFINTQNYAWTLFSSDNAITSFNSNLFNLNISSVNGTGGFTNNLGGGSFSLGLGDGGTDLVLNFSAVPEPSSCVLLASVGLALLFCGRKQRNH